MQEIVEVEKDLEVVLEAEEITMGGLEEVEIIKVEADIEEDIIIEETIQDQDLYQMIKMGEEEMKTMDQIEEEILDQNQMILVQEAIELTPEIEKDQIVQIEEKIIMKEKETIMLLPLKETLSK